MNHKRVQGLWWEEGLQRATPHKQKRTQPADGSVRGQEDENLHEVWAMEYQFDATTNGRSRSFVSVNARHRRLCLANRLCRHYKAKDVVAMQKELTRVYPSPALNVRQLPRIYCPAFRRCAKSNTSTRTYIVSESQW